jgi:hypothetical protein
VTTARFADRRTRVRARRSDAPTPAIAHATQWPVEVIAKVDLCRHAVDTHRWSHVRRIPRAHFDGDQDLR